MKSRDAFARFEAGLRADYSAVTEKEIERGQVEPPKPQRKKIRRGPRRPSSGPLCLEIEVPPRATALAAMVAAKESTTTKAVFERWFIESAETGKPPQVDLGLRFTLSLAIGSKALPLDLYREIVDFAEASGVSPEQAATDAFREGLRLAREGSTPLA